MSYPFAIQCHDADMTGWTREKKKIPPDATRPHDIQTDYFPQNHYRDLLNFNFHGRHYAASFHLHSQLVGERSQEAWLALTPIDDPQADFSTREKIVREAGVRTQINTALKRLLPGYEVNFAQNSALLISMPGQPEPLPKDGPIYFCRPGDDLQVLHERLKRIEQACKRGLTPLGDIPPVVRKQPKEYKSNSILRYGEPPPATYMEKTADAAPPSPITPALQAEITKKVDELFQEHLTVSLDDYATFQTWLRLRLGKALPQMDAGERDALQRSVSGCVASSFEEKKPVTTSDHFKFRSNFAALLGRGGYDLEAG